MCSLNYQNNWIGWTYDSLNENIRDDLHDYKLWDTLQHRDTAFNKDQDNIFIFLNKIIIRIEYYYKKE